MTKSKWLAIAVAVVCVSAIGGKLYAGHVVDKKIQAELEKSDMNKFVSYDDVSVGLLGGITLKHAVFGPESEIKVESLAIDSIDREAIEHGKIPAYGEITVHGFELAMTKQQVKQFFPKLYNLGYRDIKGDIGIEYNYSEQDKMLHIKELTLSLDGAGTLTGHLDMQVPWDAISNPDMLLMAMDAAKLKTVGLKLENDGLVDRVFDMVEKKQHISHEDAIAQLNNEIAKMSNDSQKKLLLALRDFMIGGNELEASIEVASAVAIPRLVQAIQRGDLRDMTIKVQGS